MPYSQRNSTQETNPCKRENDPVGDFAVCELIYSGQEKIVVETVSIHWACAPISEEVVSEKRGDRRRGGSEQKWPLLDCIQRGYLDEKSISKMSTYRAILRGSQGT